MCPYVLLLPDTFPHQKDRFFILHCKISESFRKCKWFAKKATAASEEVQWLSKSSLNYFILQDFTSKDLLMYIPITCYSLS